MKIHFLSLGPIAALALAGSGQAAIILTASGYVQTFDSLAASSDGQNYNVATGSKPLPPEWGVLGGSAYMVDDGDRTDSTYYSYGNGTSTERALGHRGGTGKTAGVSFENQTGQTITELYVVYWGEQWQRGRGDAADKWLFQYSTTATQLNHHSDFVGFSALDLSSPNLTSLPSGSIPLDGNAPANRVLLSGKITGLNVPVGGTFWIRWDGIDKPSGGLQDSLAIDDVYVGITPIPEASGVALAALGLLGLGLRRRR